MNIFSRSTGGGNRRVYTLSDAVEPLIFIVLIALAVWACWGMFAIEMWSADVKTQCLRNGASAAKSRYYTGEAFCIRHVNGTDYVEPIEVPR